MRRPSKLAEQRRRMIAARRPNRWATEPCPPADPEVLEHADYRMHIHDNIAPVWRALMHHYGFSIVNELHGGNIDPHNAHFILEEIRQQRQKIYETPLLRGGRSRGNES